MDHEDGMLFVDVDDVQGVVLYLFCYNRIFSTEILNNNCDTPDYNDIIEELSRHTSNIKKLGLRTSTYLNKGVPFHSVSFRILDKYYFNLKELTDEAHKMSMTKLYSLHKSIADQKKCIN